MLCKLSSVLLLLLAFQAIDGKRYAFYRSLRVRTGRRIFGGAEVLRDSWPSACVLLDRGLHARCSCSVLAPRWALTAAHCVAPHITLVQFRGTEPGSSNIVTVKLLYAHPGYRAEEKDLGHGMDVAVLHHDIGLVRTRGDMELPAPFALRSDDDPVLSLSKYKVKKLMADENDITISMLGFGMTEHEPAGERLREVQLKLVSCGRLDWWNCECALGAARGVCSGDSGGPVFYNGTQIGVTSMGPVECGDASAQPSVLPLTAMSVFTEVEPYADLINATIWGVDHGLKMRVIYSGAPRLKVTHIAYLVIVAVLLLFYMYLVWTPCLLRPYGLH